MLHSTYSVVLALVLIASEPQIDLSHQGAPAKLGLAATGFHASHVEDFDNGPCFGTCLTVLPDLDGCGVGDLALGDPFRTAKRGRVVVASGRTGRVLGWIDGPDGEPSFGRELACIPGQKDEPPCLLIAQPFGTNAAIVSVDLRDFTRHEVCRAAKDENTLGTWLRPWSRARDGSRVVEGLLILSGNSDPSQQSTGVYEGFSASCHLSRYDLAGSLQARVDLGPQSKNFDAPATLAMVHAAQADDVAIADDVGIRLLAGEDLKPRWSRHLPQKYFHVRSICSPGDLDGDGIPDLVLGCPWTTANGRNQSGVVLLVSGVDGLTIREIALSHDCEDFGFSVCAGPMSPDSKPTYLVTRPCPFSSRIYSFEGASPDPEVMWKVDVDLDCPDPGWRLESVPDLDGDSVDDVVVSRASSSCPEAANQGVVVLSGKTQKVLYALARKPGG